MYELDASRPETLYNTSAPENCEWFQKELDRIGGKQLDGSSNLRVVWGQTERKFACGRMRVKYPTQFFAEKEDYQFRLRNLDTNEVKVCTFGEFMEVKKQVAAIDLTIKFLPEYKVARQIEWIGVPRWIIEQYMPSILIKDSPSGWERNRFNWWFNPETRRQEWTDINGPFPYGGRYEHFFTVKEDDGTHNGKYRPLASDIFDEIRKAIRARDNYKPASPDKEVQKVVEAKEANLRRSELQLADEIADSLAPHVNRMYETQVKFFNEGSESRLAQSTQGNANTTRRTKKRSKRQVRRKA